MCFSFEKMHFDCKIRIEILSMRRPSDGLGHELDFLIGHVSDTLDKKFLIFLDLHARKDEFFYQKLLVNGIVDVSRCHQIELARAQEFFDARAVQNLVETRCELHQDPQVADISEENAAFTLEIETRKKRLFQRQITHRGK